MSRRPPGTLARIRLYLALVYPADRRPVEIAYALHLGVAQVGTLCGHLARVGALTQTGRGRYRHAGAPGPLAMTELEDL
jgi:DNA-binding IclR family transcriptional regulator